MVTGDPVIPTPGSRPRPPETDSPPVVYHARSLPSRVKSRAESKGFDFISLGIEFRSSVDCVCYASPLRPSLVIRTHLGQAVKPSSTNQRERVSLNKSRRREMPEITARPPADGGSAVAVLPTMRKSSSVQSPRPRGMRWSKFHTPLRILILHIRWRWAMGAFSSLAHVALPHFPRKPF